MIHQDCLKKCNLKSVNKIFIWFGPVTYFLIPSDLVSNLPLKLSRQTFWEKIMMIASKLWPLEC